MAKRYTFISGFERSVRTIESIQELVQAGCLREAVWRAEAAALNGFALAAECIDMLPRSALRSSPVLLQVYGEKRWLEGQLSIAADTLQAAAKGYMKTGLSERFLSAFASLAIVRTQMGHWHDAETMLVFLQKELDNSELPITDGRIMLALAVVARVSKQAELEAERFVSASELFRTEGLSYLALYTLAEASLRQRHFPIYAECKEALLLYTHQAGVPLELIQRLSLFMEERTGEVPISGLSRRHRELHILHTLADAANNGSLSVTDQLLLDFIHDDAEDIEVRCMLLLVKRRLCIMDNRLDDAHAFTSKLALLKQELPFTVHEQINDLIPIEAVDHPVALEGSWSIRCFDGLICMNKGTMITRIHWKRKKAMELFAYLLLQPNYSAVREVISDALFPESEPEKAVNQLHVAAHRLRQVLHEYLNVKQGLLITDGTIYLAPQLIEQVDVETYTMQVRVANQLWSSNRDIAVEMLKEAYRLYGSLLPELPYSDWLERSRVHLKELQGEVLRRLAVSAEADQDYDSATQYVAEWVSLAPEQEEAYQQLIQLLVRQERYAEAEACYRKLEIALLNELGLTPSEATKRLITKDNQQQLIGKERPHE
jgi:DNA-binding SARP family transcriptional activator